MKAIVLTRYGSPANLQLQEVDRPQPKPNEILVKVQASAVTTADTMMRRADPPIARLFLGFSRPRNNIMGTGFSGTVVRTGDAVTQFVAGDEVFGETSVNFGANAEYIAIEEEAVVLHKPESVSHEVAATLSDGPMTSYNFLMEIGKLQAGHRVLVNGASGSLGTAAVQIAKHYGAQVTGVTGTGNVKMVRSLGADEVIDYRITDFTQNGQQYDLIYDTVGTLSFGQVKNSLTASGTYLSPVLGLGLLMDMIWTSLFGKKRAKFSATGMLSPKVLRGFLNHLISLVETGELKSVIDKRYSLAQTPEGHRYIETGHKKGNVVVVM
ncbi:MAG: NAD(P)-dependent alcohol dehydrogenase [Bacteroidota bacterium]